MSYIALRIDLTNTVEKCHFCKKSLNSFSGYVLKDLTTGTEVWAGKTCAKKNISSKVIFQDIPDLTRNTLSQEKVGPALGGCGGNKTSKSTEKYALEYLLLREEKLSSSIFPGISYPILNTYYTKYQTSNLDDKDFTHIKNIADKAPMDFKLTNLQKLYSYMFWIDKALHQDSTNIFLKSIQGHLIKNKKITDKQKDAMNMIFKKIGIPQVK